MGLFGSTRKKKSVRALIAREKRLIQKKKEREELAKLRKQRRGY